MWIVLFLAVLLFCEIGHADINFCLLRSRGINSDLVEQCMDADLSRDLNRTAVYRTLTEQYANRWLACALPISSQFCDDHMRDLNMPDLHQFGKNTSDVMHLLLTSWSQKGGSVDHECIEGFKSNTASACLQLFQPLSKRTTENFSGNFFGCVSSVLTTCDDTTLMYFSLPILKYVKYRRLLEENKGELKSCVATLEKKSVDRCFYGLYDAMETVVAANRTILTPKKKKRYGDINCLKRELSGCRRRALALVQKIGKLFLRVLLGLEEHSTKAVESNFTRKNRIAKGIKKSDYDYVEELDDTDEYYHKEFSKDRFEEVDDDDEHDEYDEEKEKRLVVDIIVDKEERMMPVKKKHGFSDLEYDYELRVPLEPPYNMPPEVTQHMEDCLSSIPLSKLEYCCPGSTDFMMSLIYDRSIPNEIPIQSKICSFPCFALIIRKCSQQDQDLMKIIYDGMMDYFSAAHNEVEEVKVGEEDIVSPHHVPEPMIEHLRRCYRSGLRHKYHQCCPGISKVFHEILQHNYTLSKEVSPHTCNIICIAEIVNFYCNAEAEDTFLKITFGVINDYYQNTPEDKPQNYGNILEIPPEPPYNLESTIMGYLTECYMVITNKSFNKCCREVTEVFIALLNNKPWPNSDINPHNCNIFCMEELVNRSCVPDAVEPFRKLTYSILAHYSSDKYNKLVPKPGDTGLDSSSGKPNIYYLSMPIRDYLSRCFTVPLSVKYHACCPGIAHVFDALLRQQPWPREQIKIDRCNAFCVQAAAVKECTPYAKDAFRILLYDIIQYYFDINEAGGSSNADTDETYYYDPNYVHS